MGSMNAEPLPGPKPAPSTAPGMAGTPVTVATFMVTSGGGLLPPPPLLQPVRTIAAASANRDETVHTIVRFIRTSFRDHRPWRRPICRSESALFLMIQLYHRPAAAG